MSSNHPDDNNNNNINSNNVQTTIIIYYFTEKVNLSSTVYACRIRVYPTDPGELGKVALCLILHTNLNAIILILLFDYIQVFFFHPLAFLYSCLHKRLG